MPRADFEERIARVLETRVDRIVLCLECVTDNKNYLASLRTCDVLGVQRVVVIHPPTGDSNSGDAPKVEQVGAKYLYPTNTSAHASSCGKWALPPRKELCCKVCCKACQQLASCRQLANLAAPALWPGSSAAGPQEDSYSACILNLVGHSAFQQHRSSHTGLES